MLDDALVMVDPAGDQPPKNRGCDHPIAGGVDR